MDTVLSVLLRPVERAVGQANQLAAVRCLSRERCDAGRDGDRAHVLELEGGDAIEYRRRGLDGFRLVVCGQQERELVAAQAEGLTVLAERGRDLREDVVAGRMAEEVVDALEVV